LTAIVTEVVNYSTIKLGSTIISKDLQYQNINLNDIDNWFEIQKSKMPLLNQSIDNYYKLIMSDVDKTASDHIFGGILGGLVGISDANEYNLVCNSNSMSLKIVKTATSVLLPKLDTDIATNMFVDNRQKDDDATGKSLIDVVFNGGTIREEIKQNYYYMIPLLDCDYDSPSLLDGYSIGVLRMLV